MPSLLKVFIRNGVFYQVLFLNQFTRSYEFPSLIFDVMDDNDCFCKVEPVLQPGTHPTCSGCIVISIPSWIWLVIFYTYIHEKYCFIISL